MYSPVIENAVTQAGFTLIQVLCTMYTVQSRHREYMYTGGGVHTDTGILYTVQPRYKEYSCTGGVHTNSGPLYSHIIENTCTKGGAHTNTGTVHTAYYTVPS